jgi:hypothetical protein
MTDLLKLIFALLASLFKSRAELEAENLVLRQQINVFCRRMLAGFNKYRSLSVCLALSLVPLNRRRPCDREARDDRSLAPRWLSGLLALAIAQLRRQTESPS